MPIKDAYHYRKEGIAIMPAIFAPSGGLCLLNCIICNICTLITHVQKTLWCTSWKDNFLLLFINS